MEQRGVIQHRGRQFEDSVAARRKNMKMGGLVTACAAVIFLTIGSGTIAAQDQGRSEHERNGHTKFDDHDRQVTRDWYSQHKEHASAGFRETDRLSPNEESRLREGAVLDPNLRRKEHPVPRDLSRQLPSPGRDHRYVAIGGHVAVIDNRQQVQDVIHLHDQQ
jgi:Ni/Co efflux regulator RcnB